MSKKLFILSPLLSLLLSGSLFAGTTDTLFTAPDTVCVGHEFTPAEIVEGASNYSWTFCPPQLHLLPNAENIGADYLLSNANDHVVVEDGTGYYGFVVNRTDNKIVRLDYLNGLNEVPTPVSLIDVEANILYSPEAIKLIKEGDVWYMFILSKNVAGVTDLLKVTYGDGLNNAPTAMTSLGDLGGSLVNISELYLDKNYLDDVYVGFTFNEGNELVLLNFGSSINNTPTTTNLGNISGVFNKVSAIATIEELGNYHMYITDQADNKLIHLTFGNSLLNVPFAIDLGSLGNRLNGPKGISITKNCDDYYGYILNNIGSTMVTLYWSASVADNPSKVYLAGNVGSLLQPGTLTSFTSQEGGLYMFASNSNNTITRYEYVACTSSSIAASDQQTPPAISYTESGTYTIFLTVNQGMSNIRTYCKEIYVRPAPPLIISNDTLICQRDTITLQALTHGLRSITWTPDYMISALDQQIVNVYPEFTTEYQVLLDYEDNCIIEHEIAVKVSKIKADAGEARLFNDGSETILGGPETSLGEEFSYIWFPSDFIEAGINTPYATARPQYDFTYYLKVTNTDGCVDIDSVIVTANCDEIVLPNVFIPQGNNPETSLFGLKNLQLTKINSFKIYDRWGKLVFSTIDEYGKWDGKVDGLDAPMGTYVWEVDAFCRTNKRLRQTGTVSLIR